jgi:lactoylglutathione lyase
MKYLHTMVRVTDLEQALDFYCGCLGMIEIRRYDSEGGRFTNCFIAAPDDADKAKKDHSPVLELTYNWDSEEYTGGRNFGHLAFGVDNIYHTCEKLMAKGIVINRPPRDGQMAFVRSPDNISIELLQSGDALPVAEPWASMGNTGEW